MNLGYVKKEVSAGKRNFYRKRHFDGQPSRNFRETLIDFFLVVFVIGAWRSVWNLWNLYLFPYEPIVSNWLGLVISLLVVYIIADNKWASVV